jgi:hypothetical protein
LVAVADLFDRGNEAFGSIKDRKLLQQLSCAQLVKINSASWSWLVK